MLLPSANNYAISLATWAFGSVDAYLPAANAWLASHGLTHTRVADASGLSPQSVSSTADLVQLGKLALADPIVAAIVATRQAEVPPVGLLTNSNRLLGQQGIDGIKTGSTDEAGECLLFAADLTVGTKKVTVVGVVLGAPDKDTLYPAVSALLASVQNGFHDVELTDSGQRFAGYSAAWGASTRLVATETRSVLVWSDTPITVAVTSRPVRPGPQGQRAGSVGFTVGGETITEPLMTGSALAGPDPFWRLLNPFSPSA
jgi:serine-type D-Ala-D-Ala carboxypeptidase (penicillin-binding protein 5/6)